MATFPLAEWDKIFCSMVTGECSMLNGKKLHNKCVICLTGVTFMAYLPMLGIKFYVSLMNGGIPPAFGKDLQMTDRRVNVL